MRSVYYIGDEKDESMLQEEKKSIEDQRKTKAEETKRPTERILARLEAKKKEEIIKSIGHRRPPVEKKKNRERKKCQTKELAAQATQQKFESRLSENHLE